MREYDLTPEGFIGSTLYENGTIKCFNGRWIKEAYYTGQVRIPYGDYSGGGAHRNLALLVAKAFVSNPEGYEAVAFKDGDPTNCHADNLFWLPKKLRNKKSDIGTMRPQILLWHAQGYKPQEIVKLNKRQLSLTAIINVIAEFEQDAQSAPKSP